MRLNVGNPKVNNKTNILDIKVPKEMDHNVRTGLEHIDFLCSGSGDGITPSTVMLLTGIPAAGKTTLALMLADAIKGRENDPAKQYPATCLYNTGEESLYQISKTVSRLQLKHGFCPAYHDDPDELIEQCDSIRAENPGKQLFVIQDSLQTLEVKREEGKRGRPMGGASMEIAAMEKLTEWTKKTFSILIVIGQVTKEGVFAGRNTLKHMIDCHLHLSIDLDKKSETYNQRVAEMQKNRFGPSGLYYPFQLEERGVKFLDDSDYGLTLNSK